MTIFCTNSVAIREHPNHVDGFLDVFNPLPPCVDECECWPTPFNIHVDFHLLPPSPFISKILGSF